MAEQGGDGTPRVRAMEFVRTKLEGEAENQKAVATGETLELDADLVLRSVGYKSPAIPPLPPIPRSSALRSRGFAIRGRAASLVQVSVFA